MSAARYVQLSDDVQQALAQEPDSNARFILLNTAADYYAETGQPMTLEAARAKMREISAMIEALP